MCPYEARTVYSPPRYFSIVFAFEGDSTTTRVPDICRYSIPSTREAEGCDRTGASGRGRYHSVQPGPVGRASERSLPILSRDLAVWSRGNVSTGSTYSRPLPARPPLLGSNDHPECSEPALLAIFSDTVTRWILDYGYLAIFLLMLLESACIPIPCEVTMLFGGALASAGFAGSGQELDLVLVILAGTAGNLIG